jgi:hypothetical protein
MAVSLGSRLVLVDESTRAVLFSSVVVDEELGWRRSMMSRRWSEGDGVEQSGGICVEEEKWEKGSSGVSMPGITMTAHVGRQPPTATGAGGSRCGERGHQ